MSKDDSKKQAYWHGLRLEPTMPYYCTWLPGACPAACSPNPQVVPPSPYLPLTFQLYAPAISIFPALCPGQPTTPSGTPTVTDSECEPPEEDPGPPIVPDRLRLIEGIGPKIEGLFYEAGIYTFAQLAKAKVSRLDQILDEAGPRFSFHKTETWPKQAALAAAGEWDKLKAWQKELKGGRE